MAPESAARGPRRRWRRSRWDGAQAGPGGRRCERSEHLTSEASLGWSGFGFVIAIWLGVVLAAVVVWLGVVLAAAVVWLGVCFGLAWSGFGRGRGLAWSGFGRGRGLDPPWTLNVSP